MRKTLLILAVLILLPLTVTVKGQVEMPEEPPYAIVAMAAGGVTSGFEDWSGGFLFGGEYPAVKDAIFSSGDLSIRFIYGEFNWNPDAPLRILQPATLVKFNIVKKWKVWLVAGKDLYLAGQNDGSAFFGGFGGSRNIFTYQDEKGNFGYFDMAGEMTMTGAGDKSTGSYWQLKLGIAFRPAI